ncbi:MAG: DUF427 domain-containing protein [Salinarimonas sp.]
MKEPGPDHPITVTPHHKRVRVVLGGAIVAETDAALRLEENMYPPVFYVPRADVAMDLLDPSARRTHCPYKGDATYFGVSGHGKEARDAAWSYEDPFPAVAPIAGHIAFDRAKMDAIEELS